jgi:hypothetical protein
MLVSIGIGQDLVEVGRTGIRKRLVARGKDGERPSPFNVSTTPAD